MISLTTISHAWQLQYYTESERASSERERERDRRIVRWIDKGTCYDLLNVNYMLVIRSVPFCKARVGTNQQR